MVSNARPGSILCTSRRIEWHLNSRSWNSLRLKARSLFLILVDSPGVAPIRRLRDLVDRHEVAGHFGDELEHGRVACVVRDEELAADRTGVALSLVVVLDVDVDLLRLALDHEHRRLLPDFASGVFQITMSARGLLRPCMVRRS